MRLNNEECINIIRSSKEINVDELDSSYEQYGSAINISTMYLFYKRNNELFYRKVSLLK